MTQAVVPATASITPPVTETKAVPVKAEPVVETPIVNPVDSAHIAAQRARRAVSKRQKAEQAAQTSAYQATIAQAENARLRQEVEERRTQEQKFQTDPMEHYRALQKAGYTDAQIAAHIAKEGSSEAALEKLQKRLDEESAARKALEDSIKNEKLSKEHKEKEAKAEKTVLDKINDPKTEYPHLAKLADKLIISQINMVIQSLAKTTNPKTGRPGNEGVPVFGKGGIVEYLESLCAAKNKVTAPIVPSVTESEESPVTKAAPDTSKQTTPDKKSPAKKSSTTLTQKLGTQKFSLPENYSKLPEHRQREILADQLRQAGLAK